MDYNRRRSGRRRGPPQGNPRTEPQPPPNPPQSSTWAENIGSIHMSEPQNMVNAPGDGGSVVNITSYTVNHNHGENAQGTHASPEDLDMLAGTARADHEIYSSQLLTKKRGYPLWVPGPGMQLPIEYRRQGISIGDVGIITSTGEFDFLFNIFLPPDHPSNDGMVPQGFSWPVHHRRLDIQRTIVYGPNTYLASSSVRKTSTNRISEASADQKFESTAKEAAILILPDGATTYNLLNTRGVRSAISNNARDWYMYAREDRERDVKNGDIRVVVGIDKVSSWGMATSACNIGQTASYVFTHDPTHAYKWDCIGGSGRVGPQQGEIYDLIQGNTVLQNQCVFVRTINFTLSGKTWDDVPSEAVQQLDKESGKSGHRDSTSGSRGRSRGRGGSSGRDSGSSSHHPGPMQGALHCIPSVNFDPVELGVNHPSAAVHNRLHEKFPDANMVITEDMDWISVLNDGDVVFPEPEDLCARILESHKVLNDRGVIYLLRKDDATQRHESWIQPTGTLADSPEQTYLNPQSETKFKRGPHSAYRASPRSAADSIGPSQESSDYGDAVPHIPISGSVQGARNPMAPRKQKSSNNSHEANPGVPQHLTPRKEGDRNIGLNRDPLVEPANASVTTAKFDRAVSPSTTLPELPTIEDFNLLLEVISHKDVRRISAKPRERGDNERLAELGSQVLNNVVTLHFFSKHPLLRVEEIRTWRDHYTSPNKLSAWLDNFQLKQKLLVPPNRSDSIFNDHQQMAAYFHRYVGAVFITKGLPTIQTWISRLIDLDANIEPRIRPAQQDVIGIGSNNFSGPLTVSGRLVNQIAFQRGAPTNYVASQDGPPQRPVL